jgi:pilus assembly protein CpaB
LELTEVQKEADSAVRKAVIFGICALVYSGLFGWLLAQLNSGGPDTQDVVVAAEEIPSLSHLTASQLKVVPWPAKSMPKSTFPKVDDVLKTNMMNINALIAGEPVLAERLSTADRGLGMSQLVEPNMRGFVVQVLDSVAFADLLHPHAFVDVLVTFNNNRTQTTTTKVLLQNIQVLAVGDSVEQEVAKPREKVTQSDDHARVERHRVVTLLVALTDVEALTLASREGKIDLALRNNADSQVVTTSGATLEQILGDKRPHNTADRPPSPEPAEVHPAAPKPRSQATNRRREERHEERSSSPAIYKVKR